MYSSALMAFLHHLVAFTVVGALVAEVVMFKPPVTVERARQLQRIDAVFGMSAATVVVVGLLRVFFFEKGAGYYFTDAFFLVKLASFVAAGLLSIYPTKLFLSWNNALKQGIAPEITPTQVKRARVYLMWELTAIVIILFCAPFMARGFGYFGSRY